MEIDEVTLSRLKEISEIIKKRQGTFGKVLVGLAFSRTNKKELKGCFGLVNFLEKGEYSFQEVTYDHGNFIAIKKLIKVPEALELISSSFKNQVLKLMIGQKFL